MLSSLNVTGNLELCDGLWAGDAALDHGRIVAATFYTEHGMAALKGMVRALGRARFAFWQGVGTLERSVDLPTDVVVAQLDEIAREIGVQRSFAASAVPRVISTHGREGEVTVTRRALRVLLAIDGRQNLYKLGGQFGVVNILVQVGGREPGLIGKPGRMRHPELTGMDDGHAETSES
jgi:hypothetical protein